MKMKWITFAMTAIFLGLWQSSAEAACAYTAVQIGPVPSELTMGSTATITYRITNNVTAGGICAATDRIYQVRFKIAGTLSTFNVASTVPPLNWNTDPGKSTTTQMYFMANSWADSILPGASKDFNFVINVGTSSADVTETLKEVRARWTNQTTAFPAPTAEPTQTGSVRCTTAACKGSWTLKSLSMTLVPSTFNIGTGCQFTLTMTVTNKSTSGPITVTSVPKPPTRTGVSATTTSIPPDLSLAANGGTGTMIWTYTAGATAGTLTFTAYAQDSTATRKSSSVTTATITISTGVSCNLTATIAVTACLFTGDTATFVMTVTNNTGGAVTAVTPSALTKFTTGAAAIGAFTGPAPASIAAIANGASGTFTWTAPVTGNVNDTYYVTGFATAAGPITTATATSNTGRVGGYTVAVSPASTNAGSTNQELSWTITNNGCADVKQVQITVPAGWGLPVTDTYSMIDQYNPPNPGTNPIEDIWTVSGANPVTFAATILPPSASTDVLPLIGGSPKDGTFNLVFPTTPSSTGTSSFQITITDTNNTSVTRTTDVTVNAFNSGSPDPNANGTGATREDFP